MKLPSLFLGALLAAQITASSAPASRPRLETVGVIGNSGIEGSSLIRTKTWPGNSRGNATSGAVLDPEGTVWFNSGTALIRASLDGRHLATLEFGPECRGVAGRDFAMLGSRLYFIGSLPGNDARPQAIFMVDTAAPAAPVPVWNFGDLLPEKKARIVIAGETGKEPRLLVAYSSPPPEDQPGPTPFSIGWLYPDEGRFEEIVHLEGKGGYTGVNGIALNPETGHFYLGAAFGVYVPGDKWAADKQEIIEYSPEGKELGRRESLPLPAVPSRFRANINFAGGGVWDAAGYGFTRRISPNLESDPGIITTWDHTLDNVAQFVGIREQTGLATTEENRGVDPLLIALRPWGSVLYATYDREQRTLNLQTRIGSLPEVSALAMNEAGWIGVGTYPSLEFWWKWEDGATTPPRLGSVNIRAVSNGGFRGNTLSALTEVNANRHGKQPIVYATGNIWPVAGRSGAYRIGTVMPPVKQVNSYTVDNAQHRQAWITGTGGEAPLWRCSMTGGNSPWKPDEKWLPVEIEGGTLQDPGEIVVFDKDYVAIAEPGALVWLRQSEKKLQFVRRITTWGEGEHFGKTLHISAGPNGTLFVADEARHRLLVWSPDAEAPIALFGQTDTAGDTLDSINTPTSIASAGNRVIVYDSGNQRILKLLFVQP